MSENERFRFEMCHLIDSNIYRNLINETYLFKDLTEYFNQILIKDDDISPSVAAIKTLLEYIKQHSFGTVSELREKVVNAIDTLTKTDSSAISIKSGCEMLLRFITLTALDAGVSRSLIH